MVKIDLITGFLGAGKTTFMKRYASYLLSQGLKICILENDLGAVNVDMMLMYDMLGENCDLEMVAGGCDADCHKRRFKTKLISMGMRGFDRVLVEPSGIFDVDEFFDVLREEPLDRWYEIGNVIAIVDANLDPNMSLQAKYLLASEVAEANKIIMSKVLLCDEKQIAQSKEILSEALAAVQCNRIFDKEYLCKDWKDFTEEDFEEIANCGYTPQSFVKKRFSKEESFMSVCFMHVKMSEESLKETIKELMQDKACGKISRIKGFLPVSKDNWIECNATKEQILIQPINKGQEVIIVIGEQLLEEKIRGYFLPYIKETEN